MNPIVPYFEKLLIAWNKFSKGKKNRSDVEQIDFEIETILYSIATDIIQNTYQHGEYTKFIVCDPKERIIHKATVRDRIMHQYVALELFEATEKIFIHDSYSCRTGKGVHAGVGRLRHFVQSVTDNDNRIAYYLKCDIRKFFDRIDHAVLLKYLEKMSDPVIFNIIKNVIASFHTEIGKGLPLGNVTSQLFANVYMNTFDHFLKHDKRIKYYIRYADDFIILHHDKLFLENVLLEMKDFLMRELYLEIHPNKVILGKVSQGIDFLGYVVFPKYTKIRPKTERRILKHMKIKGKKETLESYKGFIKHAFSHRLQRKLERIHEKNKRNVGSDNQV
jgi:retron-type reverse transcriptase